MDRIRILHIIGQLGIGGCEKQLLELCRRMDRQRFDLSVCWYSRAGDDLDGAFADAGVRLRFVDKFAMPAWRFWRHLRRAIREVSPDIVHTWLYSANFWGRWAARSCGVPRLIASDRNEVWRSGLIDRVSERLLAARTVRIANSRAIAATLEEAFGLPASRTRVVHNAVAPPPLSRDEARRSVRQEMELAESSRLVVTVGRLVREKNYPMLLRVADRVGRSRPGVVFLVAGGGEERDGLARRAQDMGLAGLVRFLGVRQDVWRLLASADVFCFTSNTEGFPNGVLEAMAAGLPVVCTDFPAARELIADDRLGVVVGRDDDEAMADEILALLADPTRGQRLGAAARALAQERYSWDRLVRTMESLYEEVVTGHSHGARLDRQSV